MSFAWHPGVDFSNRVLTDLRSRMFLRIPVANRLSSKRKFEDYIHKKIEAANSTCLHSRNFDVNAVDGPSTELHAILHLAHKYLRGESPNPVHVSCLL